MFKNKLKKSELIDALTSYFNISDATANNWIKTGLIDKNITYDQLDNLFSYIESIKLNSRANKTLSSDKVIPFEYLQNKNSFKLAKFIISSFKQHNIDENDIILNSILYLLKFKGFLTIINNNIIYHHIEIKKLLSTYQFNLYINDEALKDTFSALELFFIYEDFDPLGSLYQYILYEGKKIKLGSYYTPPYLVNKIINKYNNKLTKFMDPCCGTGSFLINFAKAKKIEPQNLIGFDIDPYAVLITKINLTLLYPDFKDEFNIFNQDYLNLNDITKTLKDKQINDIDLIATNPPWRAIIKNQKRFINDMPINELFTGFIYNSIELLPNKKDAIFILPYSFLNVKKHKIIRNYLIDYTKIISIENCGRVFNNVYTPAIIIHLNKQFKQSYQVKIINKSTENININFYKNNINKEFNINVTSKDISILNKIFSQKYQTLKNKSQWALGIVTGNNSLLSDVYKKDYLPIYKGTNILPYKMTEPNFYLKFEPEKFQQVAKNNLYFSNEKIIYKFISNKLTFAYDDKQYLTLNSANILIPMLDNISLKAVLAFLNSKVFNYLHYVLFDTHKILRGNIETFPFPNISSNTDEHLTYLVDKIIYDNDFSKDNDVNDTIFNLFNLSSQEIDIINNHPIYK